MRFLLSSAVLIRCSNIQRLVMDLFRNLLNINLLHISQYDNTKVYLYDLTYSVSFLVSFNRNFMINSLKIIKTNKRSFQFIMNQIVCERN